jgi:hypothetical protein
VGHIDLNHFSDAPPPPSLPCQPLLQEQGVVAVAQKVAADEVDVLVNLAGHTRGNDEVVNSLINSIRSLRCARQPGGPRLPRFARGYGKAVLAHQLHSLAETTANPARGSDFGRQSSH